MWKFLNANFVTYVVRFWESGAFQGTCTIFHAARIRLELLPMSQQCSLQHFGCCYFSPLRLLLLLLQHHHHHQHHSSDFITNFWFSYVCVLLDPPYRPSLRRPFLSGMLTILVSPAIIPFIQQIITTFSMASVLPSIQIITWLIRKSNPCTGPEGSRSLRLPDFQTIGTWRW